MSADEVVVRALGIDVAIPATADEAVRWRRQWGRALSTGSPTVSVDTAGLPDDPTERDYALAVRVTMSALEATAGSRLNLHAGAVADASGRAVAIVGASGAGKTTAVRALARRGHYLSDETVSVDLADRLRLHPHPKPLSVVLDPARPRHKESVAPDDAGLGPTPDGARLRQVVLLHRGGDGPTGLSRASTPAAMLEIVPQTSSLVLLPHPLLTLSSVIAECGGAWVLTYDEIDDHLDEVLALLDADVEVLAPPAHHPPPETAPLPGPGEWSRAAWVDAVEHDDELVVLVDSTAHLLAGIGTTLWLALGHPASYDSLLARARQLHGEHPDAPALVSVALDELAASGLLVPPG